METESSDSDEEPSQSLLHDVEDKKPFIPALAIKEIITIPDSEDEEQADIKPDLVKLNRVIINPTDIIEISD